MAYLIRNNPPKRVLVFSDGSRSVSVGNTSISGVDEPPVEVIDVSGATDEQFAQIVENPHDEELLAQIDTEKNNS